ncbi:hypothetical protein CWI69_11855 [Pseudidiomarina halophila]|uniref:Type II secretion system protein GspF domain-containing protein n=1 Tax=Pseudidiomarina halophila TaxID=1449799 RepID=A0A432XRR5_9GAMM|nr:hypothetical protein CWI69_11855 [Pseudidiomarina halophila]
MTACKARGSVLSGGSIVEIELWQLMAIFTFTLLAVGSLVWLVTRQPFRQIGRSIERDAESSLAAFLIFIPARMFWSLLLITALPITLACLLMFDDWWWAALASIAYFACLPWLRSSLFKRRRYRIEKQLPGAIHLLASSLQAGLSLTPALELASQQLAAPLKTEFWLLVQRQRTGDSLAIALADFYQRAPSPIVRYFTFALETGNKYGGQQVQMLERMAGAIQQQHYAKERMLSLSAQARLQGKIMFVLPIGLFFAIGAVQEEAKTVLLTTTSGQLLLLLAACLMAIGLLLTRRIMGRFNDDA